MASSFLLCALAVILPVTVRNYQIHGRFILLSTNGPSTFYTGHVSHTPFLPNDPPPGATDVDMADEYRRQSWAYLREHWTKYLAEIPEFFAAIWIDGHFWPNTTTYWNYRAAFDPQRPSRVVVMIDEAGGPAFGTVAFFSDLVRYVDHVVWLLIGLPMGLLAVLFLRRENRWWLLIYLALVPYLIVPFIAPPFCRYRIPAVPLMFILAAHTIGTIWQSRKPARVGGGC